MATLFGAGLAWAAWELWHEYQYLRAEPQLQNWAKEFSTKTTVGSGKQMVFVALGDSTIKGVGVQSQDSCLPNQIALCFPGVEVQLINLGISGATLRDVVDTQLNLIPSGHLDLVAICVSANDVTHNTSPLVFREEFGRMVARLRELPASRIIIATTPSFVTCPAVPSLIQRVFYSRALAFTHIIREVSASEPKIKIVDLFEKGNLPDSDFAGDGFHPNERGYEQWSKLFVDVVY